MSSKSDDSKALNFQYNYVVDSEPNSKRRNVLCKYGSARTRDQVLPNSKYLPTTMFSFKLNDENANFWHNASFGKVRKNMLSIIGVSKRMITDKNYKTIIMTENVTKSMKQWCMKKTLTRRAANNVLLPHDGLLAFMRGILAGASQAKVLGGNAVINEDETFFVEGVAKISVITQASIDTLTNFMDMMKRLLGNEANIPMEFSCLFNLLAVYKSDDAFYHNLSKNPSLYKMETRSYYRSAAAKRVVCLDAMNYQLLLNMFHSVQASIKSSNIDWKTLVETTYLVTSPYRAALTDPNLKKPYGNDPFSFLRYGRNIHQHPGTLSHLEIEAELIKIWPHFLPCLHEALRQFGIVVGVVDEMDHVPN